MPGGGVADPLELARRQANNLLQTHQPLPLDEHQQIELTRILEVA
jgi:hypothetical protein